MRHPIYNDQVARAFFRMQQSFPNHTPADIFAMMLSSVIEELQQTVEGRSVFADAVEDITQGVKLRIKVAIDIVKSGHVLIEADESWLNSTSQETISRLKLSNFHFPFKAGAVRFNNRYLYFAHVEDSFIISLDTTDGILSVSLTSDVVIGDVIDQWTEEAQTIVHVVLSVLLYISTFVKDSQRVDTVKRVKSKCSKKSNTPRHTVQVINLRQRLRSNVHPKGTYVTGSDKVFSDKSWIVRGHWRNQYYATADEHKPIWIDPFWKGQNKDELEKVYKV